MTFQRTRSAVSVSIWWGARRRTASDFRKEDQARGGGSSPELRNDTGELTSPIRNVERSTLGPATLTAGGSATDAKAWQSGEQQSFLKPCRVVPDRSGMFAVCSLDIAMSAQFDMVTAGSEQKLLASAGANARPNAQSARRINRAMSSR